MKNLENLDLIEMNQNDLILVQGGRPIPDNYNQLAAGLLFPFYTLGYFLGSV